MGYNQEIGENLFCQPYLLKADVLHCRHAASLYMIFVPKEDPVGLRKVHYTGEDDLSNPAYDYHCALARSKGSTNCLRHL